MSGAHVPRSTAPPHFACVDLPRCQAVDNHDVTISSVGEPYHGIDASRQQCWHTLQRVRNVQDWRTVKSTRYYGRMNHMVTRIVLTAAAFAALVGTPRHAFAQPAVGAPLLSLSARNATRAELQAALRLYENSAASPAYSDRILSQARAEASAVRTRLANGDFHVGDRIHLSVQGPTQLVNDTLTVGDSLILNVTGIRPVRLHGVLRSELHSVLLRDLGEVVREVRVSARPLMRVAVLGQVLRPGFQSVPSETLVDQLITGAGGPAPTAALDKLRLMRGDTVLFEGAELSRAIAESQTLGALDLRDGDVLVVTPQGAPWDRNGILQVASFFVGPLLTILVVR